MIEFRNVVKNYRRQKVIKDISFGVGEGEVVVIIGPSGCGKTTTLKMINRLVDPTSGTILVDGRDIGKQDPIGLRRNIGYVIQQTGLFSHMTVRENIELVPSLRRGDPKKIAAKSVELMEMVGMNPGEFLDRYPVQLSGGQQQRVGVARAFACDPEIILMDEPFSAVDPIARAQLQNELSDIQAKLRKTIVFVTHDIDEAVRVGDRICIMREGEIVQHDLVENVLKNPANSFVNDFIGKYRIWTAPELIRARDIMIPNPVICQENASVLRCMETMRAKGVNSVLLATSRNVFRGIVHGRAVRGCRDRSRKAQNIAETGGPTVRPDDSIPHILALVNDNDVAILPVVDEDGVLHGLLTKSSLVTTLSQQFLDTEEVM